MSVSAWYFSAASNILATFATDTILRAECSQRTLSSSSRNSEAIKQEGGAVVDIFESWRRWVERVGKTQETSAAPQHTRHSQVEGGGRGSIATNLAAKARERRGRDRRQEHTYITGYAQTITPGLSFVPGRGRKELDAGFEGGQVTNISLSNGIHNSMQGRLRCGQCATCPGRVATPTKNHGNQNEHP